MKEILLVDDNEEIQPIYRMILEKGGYKMSSVSGGEECLSFLQSSLPDLILLDIMMEPMDGWETLEAIVEIPGTGKIPVLPLSGKALLPDELKKFGDRIAGYVMKPIIGSMLCEEVGNVFIRHERAGKAAAKAESEGLSSAEAEELAHLLVSVEVEENLYIRLKERFRGRKVREEDLYPQTVIDIGQILDEKKARLSELKAKAGI